MYKRDYAFRMNVMEEIFEIRSCIEILANDIKVDTADEYNHLDSKYTRENILLNLTENCNKKLYRGHSYTKELSMKSASKCNNMVEYSCN